MSEWDEFSKWLGDQEKSASTADMDAISAGTDLDKVADAHLRLTRLQDAIKSALAHTMFRLTEGQTPMLGATIYVTPDKAKRVTLEWRDAHSWDHDTLAALCAAAPEEDPAFIKRALRVDRKAWDAATVEERQNFAAALTVKLAGPKITVERIA